MRWAWEHPLAMAELGKHARVLFKAKYTAEHNYPLLMDIYRQAREVRAGRICGVSTENG